MIRPMIAIAAVLALTACAKPLEVASVTSIKSHTGSPSLDVHEPRRKQGQTGVPEFAGDQLVEVRSYVYKDGEGEKEFAGATCTLSAAEFSATMTTPAQVRVPLYRGQSSVLSVGCESQGLKKRSITVEPVDIVRQQRYANSGGGGLIGVVATVAIDAMADNTKNDWRYPLARVVMEPESSSRTAAQ